EIWERKGARAGHRRGRSELAEEDAPVHPLRAGPRPPLPITGESAVARAPEFPAGLTHPNPPLPPPGPLHLA
ncbi:hypothetical protein P7K49_029883, partial [Saguinus oedipus]